MKTWAFILEYGEYKDAESCWLEVLKLRAIILGEEHQDYAQSVVNLGVLYIAIGDFEKARSFFQKGLSLTEQRLGNSHPNYINALMNFGALSIYVRDFSVADSILLLASETAKQHLGVDHPFYVNSIYNRGALHTRTKDYKKAEYFFKESLKIRERILGENHPDYAISLKELGALQYEIGNYQLALPMLKKALSLIEQSLGKEHPYYLQIMMNLAALHHKKERFEKATSLIVEANTIQRIHIMKAVQFLSQTELLKYSNLFEYNRNLLHSFGQSNMDLTITIFERTLFEKGLILLIGNRLNHLVPKGSYNTKLFLGHKSYLRRLSNEYAKPIAERQNVAELEEKANALEKELVRTVAGYGDAIRQVEWSEVRDALQPGEAAVEFIHYNYYTPDPTDSVMYAALVLRPGDEALISSPC